MHIIPPFRNHTRTRYHQSNNKKTPTTRGLPLRERENAHALKKKKKTTAQRLRPRALALSRVRSPSAYQFRSRFFGRELFFFSPPPCSPAPFQVSTVSAASLLSGLLPFPGREREGGGGEGEEGRGEENRKGSFASCCVGGASRLFESGWKERKKRKERTAGRRFRKGRKTEPERGGERGE